MKPSVDKEQILLVCVLHHLKRLLGKYWLQYEMLMKRLVHTREMAEKKIEAFKGRSFN